MFTNTNAIPCKIYNDGGHYVATMLFHGRKGTSNKGAKTKESIFFDNLYENSFKEGIKKKDKFNYFKEGMLEEYPEMKNPDEFVENKMNSKAHNYYNRLKRFRRKANLNEWNYFVTLTYDSKKMSEETFRKKLRKCLSNLHSRRGWRYMGVFEKGTETDRLHFHALMYIPAGNMIGKIEEKHDYSTEHKMMQTAFVNTFFATTFGRNDFKELKKEQLKFGNGVNYITKYISKTNERIVYSRGIKSELCRYVDKNDIATEMEDFVLKYILFDDVIDWETDIMNFKYEQPNLFENDNDDEEFW